MASTYVNDLRLNEMATGDASGTWGTITNTNLELIGEALGYATQDCFASDADATTTVADGATDPARAIYFKVTSSATLTATRTLTIAPNTVSRLQFIENATTGSQSINISQGSGANVTIPSGQTKAVYFDGAGSGAAVTDSFALLNLNLKDNVKLNFGDGDDLQIYHNGTDSKIYDGGTGNLTIESNGTQIELKSTTGDMVRAVKDDEVVLFYSGSRKLATTNTGIDVTGTAVTDGLTVAGNVSVDGGTIKLDGNYPVGTDNVALGNTALDSVQTGGNENTAIGANSMTTNTTGSNNTAVGINSLSANTTGVNNTAVGRLALYSNTTAGSNVSIGNSSMQSNTTGGANTAIGTSALTANTTASNNTAVGYAALTANTTGATNSAFGYQALLANTTGADNTAIGTGALGASVTGSNNTAVGMNALTTSTVDNNTAIGWQSLQATTTGTNNTGLGLRSLYTNTTGGSNTALGKDALFSNTTASNNTAVGYQAGYSNTTGTANTAVGHSALLDNTTAVHNTAVGSNALGNTTTGSDNTAIGYSTMFTNTTGVSNVALGKETLYANTTAQRNTGVGFQSLSANTTGSYNTAVGYRALTTSTTAGENTAIGNTSMYSNTTGYANVAIGAAALYSNTTGLLNNCFGYGAGYHITTGSKNTLVGAYNGNQGGYDMRTRNNNIALSDGDGNIRFLVDDTGRCMIGNTSTADMLRINNTTASGWALNVNNGTATDKLIISSQSGTGAVIHHQFNNSNGLVGKIETSGSSTTYATSSDYRLKENVVDMTGAIDRVKQLLPKRFNFIADADLTVDGFLAHEAQTVIPEAVSGIKDAVDEDGNIDPQSIDQSKLVPLLTGALKEAIAKIENLEARILALENG